jgi:3-methyladenine DNA glycosylase AlkD
MNSQELITDIRSYCVKNVNKANVVKYSRYFKEGLFQGYGLTTLQMTEKAKELSRKPGLSIGLLLEAAPGLILSGQYEETALLILVTRSLNKQYSQDVFNSITGWYSLGIKNWAHSDAMCSYVLHHFLGKGIVGIPDFRAWLAAENKYQRRSVPVTFIKLLKTHQHFGELFTFLEPLMTDPEREVHQGMGWFLREAWKKKPLEAEAFLLKWKEVAPRLIIQYATEKMTAEAKQRFRRTHHN